VPGRRNIKKGRGGGLPSQFGSEPWRKTIKHSKEESSKILTQSPTRRKKEMVAVKSAGKRRRRECGGEVLALKCSITL